MDEIDPYVVTLYVGDVKSSDTWSAPEEADAVNDMLRDVGMDIGALHRLGQVLGVKVQVKVQQGHSVWAYYTGDDWEWLKEGGAS